MEGTSFEWDRTMTLLLDEVGSINATFQAKQPLNKSKSNVFFCLLERPDKGVSR